MRSGSYLPSGAHYEIGRLTQHSRPILGSLLSSQSATRGFYPRPPPTCRARPHHQFLFSSCSPGGNKLEGEREREGERATRKEGGWNGKRRKDRARTCSTGWASSSLHSRLTTNDGQERTEIVPGESPSFRTIPTPRPTL